MLNKFNALPALARFLIGCACLVASWAGLNYYVRSRNIYAGVQAWKNVGLWIDEAGISRTKKSIHPDVKINEIEVVSVDELCSGECGKAVLNNGECVFERFLDKDVYKVKLLIDGKEYFGSTTFFMADDNNWAILKFKASNGLYVYLTASIFGIPCFGGLFNEERQKLETWRQTIDLLADNN